MQADQRGVGGDILVVRLTIRVKKGEWVEGDGLSGGSAPGHPEGVVSHDGKAQMVVFGAQIETASIRAAEVFGFHQDPLQEPIGVVLGGKGDAHLVQKFELGELSAQGVWRVVRHQRCQHATN